MSEVQRKSIIEGLNGVFRELEHWAFVGDLDRAKVEDMRRRLLEGLKLIYEQENIIKALMGDYGDRCDVDERCEGQGGKA